MNSPPEPAATRKKRILLVDDEPFLTTLLRMNLEDTGQYEVREENNSLKALDVIKEFMPDLILLDADPLADIRNTRRIWQVMHDGQLIDRPAILKAIRPR